MRTFQDEKEKIHTALQSALSAIHITLDLWTSSNYLALLGIIAHYTNENGNLQQSMLAMYEVEGQHSGENLAVIVLDVIQDYGIQTKLGYFMCNNASNNNTML